MPNVSSQFEIIPIAALKDNYIWALIDKVHQTLVIVDPGEFLPIDIFIQEQHLSLKAILVTHHHWDHTNGIEKLIEKYNIPVWGPAKETLPTLTRLLHEKDEIHIPSFSKQFSVLDIPGHTAGHIAYYAPGILFCGDTLFAGGCGRIFEGTAKEMFDSLQKIAELPDDTKIYCAHEYTRNNLNFAKLVEPNNEAIEKRIQKINELQKKKLPTLPSILSEEKATNPFLRCEVLEVKMQAEKFAGQPLPTAVDVFAALRKWKGW